MKQAREYVIIYYQKPLSLLQTKNVYAGSKFEAKAVFLKSFTQKQQQNITIVHMLWKK